MDNTLLLLELKNGEWLLLHAARNAKYPTDVKQKPSPWTTYDVTDTPYAGDRNFKNRPRGRKWTSFCRTTPGNRNQTFFGKWPAAKWMRPFGRKFSAAIRPGPRELHRRERPRNDG
jgi:hypothetical protein